MLSKYTGWLDHAASTFMYIQAPPPKSSTMSLHRTVSGKVEGSPGTITCSTSDNLATFLTPSEPVQDTLPGVLEDITPYPPGSSEHHINEIADGSLLCESDTEWAPELLESDKVHAVFSEEISHEGDIAAALPSTSASCSPHLDIMPHQSGAGEQDLVIARESWEKGEVESAHNTHVMYIEAETDPTYTWDVELDDEVLRYFYRGRHNLVLDSLHPERVPHIVVTPAYDTWDDHVIPWANRVDPQWSGNLMVPSLYTASVVVSISEDESHPNDPTSPLPELETPSDIVSNTNIPPPAVPGVSVPKHSSKTVWNSSKFCKIINKGAQERLIMYHVVKAVHKLQFKANVVAASLTAVTFRRRYDSPEFVWAAEKPFHWTDPAEPLIQTSTYTFGATVIESSCAFRAPHIIINAPPPQSPWISWANALNDPQDYGHGRYLTVPSRSVTVINVPSREEYQDWGSDSTPTSLVDPYQSPSETGPHSPGTPDDDDDFFMDEQDLVDEISTLTPPDGHASLFEMVMPDPGNGLCHFSRPSCLIFADDDEGDELPPFDEWYQTSLMRL